MFERFTERARQIVVLAQALARDHAHSYIGADHLLVAIAREGEGLGARVLDHLGFNAEAAEAHLLELNTSSPHPLTGQLPFTPRAKKALELALREALTLGHNYIGTETILLGLVREGSDDEPELSPSVKILRRQNIGEDAIRREVLVLLGHPDAKLSMLGRSIPELAQRMVTDQARLESLQRVSQRPSFRAPSFGLTRPQIQDIGESALYSMDIVGLPPEFVAGYAKLADAASHLLNLCADVDAARASA